MGPGRIPPPVPKSESWLTLGTLGYSRGLKSEQFSWMWTNRLRKSRHDRVTAGSQQSIKTQGDCLHLKDTKYHYNKHERAHPSHCRLLFCQHCFDLRRSKTEWTKETMKREEATVCEKEREEDKTRCSPRTRMLTRMLMVQMSKHMDMQSRRTLFCNSLMEQSCTYFLCYQSAVWSVKCGV